MMRLYIHAGLPKTGSTAIQKYLHENSIGLRRLGYCYPEINGNEDDKSLSYRSSGNAYPLYIRLAQNLLNKEKRYGYIIDYLKWCVDVGVSQGVDGIIISSEMLSMLCEEEVKAVVDGICEVKIDFKFIYYTRNPYEWFFSSWLQGVKREGVNKWITEKIVEDADYLLRPLIFPKIVRSFLLADQFVELRYEEVQGNLVFSFLRSLGIPEDEIDQLPKAEDSIVNRSLTIDEFAFFYFANKGSRGNVKLSEILSSMINNNRQIKNERFFFIDKFSIDLIIDWCRLNSPELFDEYSSSLARMSIEASPMSESIFENGLSVDQLFTKNSMNVIIEFYQNIFNEARVLAYHKCLHYADSEYLSAAPSDFNVFLYLVMNQDVLFSNVDPYWHFLKYGENDKRTYKLL